MRGTSHLSINNVPVTLGAPPSLLGQHNHQHKQVGAKNRLERKETQVESRALLFQGVKSFLSDERE